MEICGPDPFSVPSACCPVNDYALSRSEGAAQKTAVGNGQIAQIGQGFRCDRIDVVQGGETFCRPEHLFGKGAVAPQGLHSMGCGSQARPGDQDSVRFGADGLRRDKRIAKDELPFFEAEDIIGHGLDDADRVGTWRKRKGLGEGIPQITREHIAGKGGRWVLSTRTTTPDGLSSGSGVSSTRNASPAPYRRADFM